jgi:hypothetical protein
VPEVGLETGFRPSPATVRPGPKPRVCTLCTPSLLPTSARPTRLLRRPSGRGSCVLRAISLDMKSRPPVPDPAPTRTHNGGGPHAGSRRPSWRRVLVSERLMEKRTATCMPNRQPGPPRSEHAPPTAQRSPPQPSDHYSHCGTPPDKPSAWSTSFHDHSLGRGVNKTGAVPILKRPPRRHPVGPARR